MSILIILSLALTSWMAWDCSKTFREYGMLSPAFLSKALFIIYYPISAVAHLVFTGNHYRGYFDTVFYRGEFGVLALNLYALLLCVLGYLVLGWGLKLGRLRDRFGKEMYLERSGEYTYLLVAGVAFASIGLVSTTILNSYVSWEFIDREAVLAVGAARYAFLSTWLVWGVGFIAFWNFLNRRTDGSVYLGVFSVALVAAITVYWTAGRAIVVLLCLPIILSLGIYRPKAVLRSLPVVAGFGVLYIAFVTSIRKQGYAIESTALSQVLDWEMGRFSMVAYSIDYVRAKGILWGSSWFDAFLTVISAPLQFLGFGQALGIGFSPNATVSIIAQDLTGSLVRTHIVPGALSEAYLNLGFLGPLVVFFLAGFFLSKLELLRAKSLKFPARVFFYSYLTALLLLNFFNTTLYGFLANIVFNGFPLLVMAFVFERFSRDRRLLS